MGRELRRENTELQCGPGPLSDVPHSTNLQNLWSVSVVSDILQVQQPNTPWRLSSSRPSLAIRTWRVQRLGWRQSCRQRHHLVSRPVEMLQHPLTKRIGVVNGQFANGVKRTTWVGTFTPECCKLPPANRDVPRIVPALL